MRPGAYLHLCDQDKSNFIWLLSLLERLRPDLRPSVLTSRHDFIAWLITHGIREYPIFRNHCYFRQYLSEKDDNLPMTRLQAALYNSRPDVRKLFPLPARLAQFNLWFLRHGIREHNLDSFIAPSLAPQQPATFAGRLSANSCSNRNAGLGVNLIGYPFAQFGVGEDLRMTARALEQADVPFTIINFPPENNASENDRSLERHVGEDAPYPVNLFCMSAPDLARFYLKRGADFFRNRYNIGFWPWELAQWPAEWADLTRLVDEVWVSTTHIYKSLAAVSDVPVLVMPLAVETGDVSPLGRRDFGLPADSFLFCFAFDPKSAISRKNPSACLAAFRMAFPLDARENVGLVIKSHKPQSSSVEWEMLRSSAAKDPRIFIIEGTLPRSSLLALYKSCDCFLSLHRAEGFGRNIAEAMLLGLDVIATGYSGNVDFCRDQESVFLVDYSLVPIRSGEYPHGEGQLWAEPDIRHAAELMRICASRKRAARKSASFQFSLDAAGSLYKNRLAAISAMRNRPLLYESARAASLLFDSQPASAQS